MQIPMVYALLFWLVTGSGCAAGGGGPAAVTSPAAPTGRAGRAVEAAIAFARQQGYPVDDYVAKAQKDGAEWRVNFTKAPPQRPGPGDFFTVYVDDRTMTASRIVPGK
jgi:hypothetical protein